MAQMLKTLVKIRLLGLLSGLTRGRSGKNAKKKMSVGAIVGFSLLYLYLAGVMIFMFGGMFFSLSPLAEVGLGWVYFAAYGIICFALMIIGSAAIAKTQIFDAKDNDLLMSLPVPPSYIIISRMVTLLVTNLAYMLVVIIPAVGVWWYSNGFGILWLVIFILLSAALLLFSTAVGIFMGWVITLISRKAKNKTLVSSLFTLVFLFAYLYFWFTAQENLEKILLNIEDIAVGIKNILPIYWFGEAIAGENILYALITLVIFTLPFVVAVAIISKTFYRIVSDSKSSVRIKDKKVSFNAVPVSRALLRRECARLFSSASYLTNSGIGVIFAVIGAVALLIKKDALLSAFGQDSIGVGGLLAPLLLVGFMFIFSMVIFTSATISIEGKNIWILQSLPVSPVEIFKAKIKLHVYACLPALILSWAAINIGFYAGLLFAAVSLVILALFVLIMAQMGLAFNLSKPVLDWQDEAVAVKTGMSVMFTMFAGMALAVTPLIAIFLLADYINFVLIGWAVIEAAIALMLYKWLTGSGVKKFEEL